MLETQSKEEILGIDWGRPRTSRQVREIAFSDAAAVTLTLNSPS
jgi:hypothetical protein